MSRVVAGAILAAAIAAAGSAGAAEIPNCVWTGSDWACGKGAVYTRHYPLGAGPDMVMTPLPTQIPAERLAPNAPNDSGQRP